MIKRYVTLSILGMIPLTIMLLQLPVSVLIQLLVISVVILTSVVSYQMLNRNEPILSKFELEYYLEGCV